MLEWQKLIDEKTSQIKVTCYVWLPSNLKKNGEKYRGKVKKNNEIKIILSSTFTLYFLHFASSLKILQNETYPKCFEALTNIENTKDDGRA